MTLTPDDIARLFELYLPDHACGVTRQEDGAFTLQFTHRSRHDVLTVPGLAASQLASAVLIKRLSLGLAEEFAAAARSHLAFRLA